MKHDDTRSIPEAKEKSANTHKTNTPPFKEKTLEAPVEDNSEIIDLDDDNESLPDVLEINHVKPPTSPKKDPQLDTIQIDEEKEHSTAEDNTQVTTKTEPETHTDYMKTLYVPLTSNTQSTTNEQTNLDDTDDEDMTTQESHEPTTNINSWDLGVLRADLALSSEDDEDDMEDDK